MAIILNILKSMSPLHSTVVTYQEYSDGVGPSPKGGPEPARPPLNPPMVTSKRFPEPSRNPPTFKCKYKQQLLTVQVLR